MPTVIDPRQYIVGAADVYYRAAGATSAWLSVGATVDDIAFRVMQQTFNPSEEFNGLLEKIKEFDYLSKAGAECEFTMPEIAGSKLAIPILGVVETAGSNADAGSGLATTLAAAAAIGDTSIKVASVTGAAAGDYVRINVAGALAEYRRIDVVGTSGSGGTGLQFRDPLLKAHASGVAAVEAVGDGKTEFTPGTTRRMPSTAYRDFALVAQSPNDYYELFLYNAIAQDQAEISFGDESLAGIRTVLGTRRDGLALSSPSWRLRVPAAA